MNSSNMNSSNRNPQDLVDRYLQAVRFWLPASQKQELIAELSEDLHSQIDEKEAASGRPLNEDEVAAVLKQCGRPMMVASRFQPQAHLIGPALFPIYRFVLKMVLLWILMPVFVFIIGPVNVASAHNWTLAAARTLGDLWTGLFVAAGTITLVFAILERTQAQLALGTKWDPRALPPVRKPERKTSLGHTVCDLVFGCFGLMWLLLVPSYPVLILGPAAVLLKGAPLWHTLYVPILVLSVAALMRSAVMLVRPQWTWFPPLSQLTIIACSLILLTLIINAAQTPGGSWHQFVVLADNASPSAGNLRVATVVNVSTLIGLVIWRVALYIAAVIQVWQLLRSVLKRDSSPQQAASLHLQ